MNFSTESKNEKSIKYKIVLSENQMKWVDIQKMIIKAKPDFESSNVPKSKFRKFFHQVVITNKFEILIMGCIILNMVQMAIIYDGASDLYSYVSYHSLIHSHNLIYRF